MRGVSLRVPAGQHRDRLAFWVPGTLALAARARGLGVAFSHHRVHLRPVVGQLDRGAMVGVTVAQVDLAGAQVGGFQVGGSEGVAVEHLVVGAQQRGAGSLALPVWPHGQDGQVMVGDAGRVVPVERRIEDGEAAGPRARRGGQPRAVTVGLVLWVLADAEPQRDRGAVGGGVHGAAGHRVVNIEPEIAGEDPAAGVRVGYQPPGRRQVVEGACDDLAEGIEVGRVRGDHLAGRGDAYHRVPSLAGASWPVTAWAPRPIAA
jgi:hypothetical protein